MYIWSAGTTVAAIQDYTVQKETSLQGSSIKYAALYLELVLSKIQEMILGGAEPDVGKIKEIN